MKAQKFLANYKCECYGHDFCNCPRKELSGKLFLENVNDVASALVEIMTICGIHQCKAKASFDVIIHAFLHYDEIRHRIDAVAHKRLCKEDLIHDLGRKCLMNRLEAHLSYSIVKRAFKAFYHGTTEGGIRNPILEAQLIHSQECMWVHAAKRTAQIFAGYEGMFFSAQQHYEAQIRCVYKELYDKLQQRANPVEVPDCQCSGCLKRAALQSPHVAKMTVDHSMDTECLLSIGRSSSCKKRAPSSTGTGNEDNANVKGTTSMVSLPRKQSQASVNLPHCYKCNCPKLICDCDVNRESGVLSAECSQGPYKCQWIRVDDEVTVPNIEIPEDHVCPVDCDEVSDICDPECECDCGDVCECQPEDSSDVEIDDEYTISTGAEVREEEEDNSIELDSGSYGGCCAISHVIEEMVTKTPISIANVVGHKREGASVISKQASTLNCESTPRTTYPVGLKELECRKRPICKKTDLTEEERRKENEEIMKLIGTLI